MNGITHNNGKYAYILLCVSLLSFGMVMYKLYDYQGSGLNVWQSSRGHANDRTVKEITQKVLEAIKDHDKVIEKLVLIEEETKLEKEQDSIYSAVLQEKERIRAAEREEEAKNIAKSQVEEENEEEKDKQSKLHSKLEELQKQMQQTEYEKHGGAVKFEKEDYDKDGLLQPTGSKVVLVTASDDEYRSFNMTQHEQMMQNRREYADRHNYELAYIDSTEFQNHTRYRGRDKMWRKIPSIIKAYNDYPDAEWFWWLDVDAIIMNTELPLAEALLHPKVLEKRLLYGNPLQDIYYKYVSTYPEKDDIDIKNIDFVICRDDMGLNAGSFMFRRSQFMDMFLQMWNDDLFKDREWWQFDQSVMQHLLIHNGEPGNPFLKHLGLVTQRSLNSYRDWGTKNSWMHYHPGDLVIHFAGIKKTWDEWPSLWDDHFSNRVTS